MTNTFLLAGLLSSQASADILAEWLPAAAAEPNGAQYSSAANTPVADNKVPELFVATARRVDQTGAGNDGAVWPGGVDSVGIDLESYTAFDLEVPDDAEIQLSSFTYFMNTYGFERNPNGGDTELSTIQLRLRSSVDDFASDIDSITSLPDDRDAFNDLEFNFDLSGEVGLQTITGPVEFRLYVWEENSNAANDPFMWIDMAGGGANFDGTVTDPTETEPVVRIPLVEIFPEPRPAEGGLPPNNSAITPSKITLSEGVGSVDAIRVEQGAGNNVGSVWPGSVDSVGFDEFSYLETIVTPAPGATLTISDFVIPRFIPYNTNDGGAWEAVIRSSVDNFAEDLATTSGEGEYRVAFDLSEITELQAIKAPITFRLYLWETAAVEGAAFESFMWFDIAGNGVGTAPGIQVLGDFILGSVAPPTISSAVFDDDQGFVVEATNLTPGRTYGLFFSSDLTSGFTALGIEEVADETTLTLVDDLADLNADPKAFYQVREVTP